MLITGLDRINAQSVIKPGNISGTWTKKASPYIIRGDVNIPAGKSLTIQPGVEVQFDGHYTLNVQGSLMAVGTENDSIIFTVADTSGIKTRQRYGWNGIRFDRRTVKWDTLRFLIPEDEEFKKIVEQRINDGDLDTTTKIRLTLTIADEVNDTVLPDSLFLLKQPSQLEYCRFEYGTAAGKSQPYVFGGAIYIYRYSNLFISHCTFENNFAYAGGAIYCKEAAPVITNNRVTRCSAQSSGGAMVFVHSGPVLMNNYIADNTSGYNGGGILFYESSPYVVNNKMLRNKADNSGGGMYCEKRFEAFLTTKKYTKAANVKFARDNTFEKASLKNVSLRNASSYNGRFQNNIICSNSATMGGGMGLCAVNPELTNNTISNNIASEAGGGIACYYAAPQVANAIIYGNTNHQVFLVGESAPAFHYCDIENNLSGIKKDTTCKVAFEHAGIINALPRFTDPAGYDYSLSDGSPCIDAGMPDTASLKLPLADYRGKSRIVNRRIDMGAIEYAPGRTKLKSTEENLTSEDLTIEDSRDEQMLTTVFPNPSSGSFSLVIRNNKYQSVSVKIYSTAGKEVYINDFKAGVWFEHKFDLSALPAGIYVLLVHSGEDILYNGELIFE
jgi:predicted outer membrane repeat protein